MYNDTGDSFSFGFRNIHLLLKTNYLMPLLSQFECSMEDPGGPNASCNCGKGLYNNPESELCKVCDASCYTCIGATSANCTSCASGYSFDGTQCFQCDPSCSQCRGTTNSDCIKCTGGNFLYPDGTCQPVCDTPLIPFQKGSTKMCLTCEYNNYIYQNGTCQPECHSPYTVRTEGNIMYCNFPCDSTSYLSWDGSCKSDCPLSYQSTRDGYRYCRSHCVATEYLYWDGQCRTSCEYPLKQSQGIESYLLCKKPCLEGEIWNPLDNSCALVCPISLMPNKSGLYDKCEEIPTSPVDGNHNNNNTKSNNNTNTKSTNPVIMSENENSMSFKIFAQKLMLGATIMGDIIRPKNVHSVFLIALVKLIKYVRFLDISLPYDVKQAFSSQSSSIYSITTMFSFKMPQNLKEKFPRNSLPAIFEENELHSSYLVNQWESL